MEARQIVLTVASAVAKVVIAALVVMLVYRYSISAYDYGYRVFGEEPVDEPPGQDIEIDILSDDSPSDVGETLEEKGLIRDANLFVIQERLGRTDGGMAPGHYVLNTSMTIEEMVGVIESQEEEESEDE